MAPGSITNMSDTGGIHVVPGARGVNYSGKTDAPAGVKMLAADLSSGPRRARTRNTASQ